MTKTQLKLQRLEARCVEITGMRRYGLRLWMLILEIFVAFHKVSSIFYKGKSKTFEQFAKRSADGSYAESFTEHEKFRKVSFSGVAFAVLLTIIYVTSGIFVPNKISIRAASFAVNDLSDGGDGVCDETCTFRDALEEANANGGEPDSIGFDVSGTISIGLAFSNLAAGGTYIDGDTDGNGTPDIVINAASMTSGSVFNITSSGNTIHGVVIQNAPEAAITINGNNNSISSNYIGTNSSGTAAAPNSGPGIFLVGSSTGNVIGGNTSATRNVISGNAGQGILLDGASVSGNTISGNYIGTNAAGTAAIPNTNYGISITNGAHDNTVGGNISGGNPGTGLGNIIAGNASMGVSISNTNTNDNIVAGNLIGLAADGTTALGNGDDGVNIGGSNTGNMVGGVSSNFRNIISGHVTAQGIDLGSSSNTAQNNYVGTNRAGTAAVANRDGIFVGGTSNIVRDNLVSGNTYQGIRLVDATTNTVAGNIVGLNAAGSSATGNGENGVTLSGTSTGNIIGGTSASERNIISGNIASGIVLGGGGGDQSGTTENTIEGNYIGTDVSGTSAIANVSGIEIRGNVSGNTIGGTVSATSCSGACNVIAGNTDSNVYIRETAHENNVYGNYINIRSDGTRPLVLQARSQGVFISDGAYGNNIGGDRDENVAEIGQGNVLGGFVYDSDANGSVDEGSAIFLASDAYNAGTSTGNNFYGNFVGVSPAGDGQDLYDNTTGASGADGLNDFRNFTGLTTQAHFVHVGNGTALKKNVISGNIYNVTLAGESGLDGIAINENYIGTNKTGTSAIANLDYTQLGAYKVAVGIFAGGTTNLEVKNNVISGEGYDLNAGKVGVALWLGDKGQTYPNGNTDNTIVTGNKIGTNKDGTAPLANLVGIMCDRATNLTIGGAAGSDRNIISGNGSGGNGGPISTNVYGNGTYCNNITVQNNYFGTDATGNAGIAGSGSIQMNGGAHDIDIASNLLGGDGASALDLDTVSNFEIQNNVFGIGADGTTELAMGGSGVITLSGSDVVSIHDNQFGGGHGPHITNSTNITFDTNYVGTNTAKTASFNGQEGPSFYGGQDITISNNTIRHRTAPALEEYILSNSPFTFGGHEYNEILGANNLTCNPGQKGLQTYYYDASASRLDRGVICNDKQVYQGPNNPQLGHELNTSVSAFLVSKAGHYYTYISSQNDGGPITCSFVASSLVGGATCEKEFTLFVKGSSGYDVQALPAGVSLATGALEPSMTLYDYASGLALLGVNGGVTVSNNEISSNTSRGITVVGGTDVTLDQNTLSNNGDDGINLIETTGNTVTSNAIDNSGNNGIELSKSTSNIIGSLGNGNTISNEDLNGIALLSASDSNTLSTNTVTSCGNSDTINGAGIYINESSSNTLYNNTLNTNVRGVALSSSDALPTLNNTIGGTSTNQPNTIHDNHSSGILLQGNNTQENTVSGNSISGNGAYGIDNSDTHTAGAVVRDLGDNALRNNVITMNTLSGIRSFGASPSITQNTISQNLEHGIKTVVDFGSTTNPDTESDDILSEPTISENTLNSNHLYGIYSFDTAPTNKATLADDNTFDNGNEQGRVRQEWYGLVQALADGTTPEADAVVQIFGSGQADPLAQFTTTTNGFGPSSASLTDVETWQAVPEFEVSPSGTFQDFAPHRIFATGSAGTALFAFDGTEKTATDFGNINGRYQVATVDLTEQPNTIRGKVFLDTDKNGSMDSGESAAANVTVTIYLSSDTTFGNDSVVGVPVVTGADGVYTFTNIPQGKYFVTIAVPSGFAATTPNPSNLITFAAEAQTETRDFGIVANPVVAENTANIHGTVFEDTNKNGIYEGGENGLKSITVKLFEDTNSNSKYDEGVDEQIDASTSNSSGAYQLNNLPLAHYFLTLTVPSGRSITTDNNPTDVLTLATANQTLTENFGLTALPVAPPPTNTNNNPKSGGGVSSIAKFITGAGSASLGLLAPQTGAANANALVAVAAVALGVINLLGAVPGASWPAASRLLLDGFTEPLLALFGSKKLPWGRLYDALSKKPVDLGLVRLYDAKSRILLGTAVTDRTGRFKFLPKPGMYKAVASKQGYSFPSSLLTAAPVYEKQNMYFGDQIKIDEMNQAFTKDIPLDPAQMTGDSKTVLKLRAKQTAHSIFAFGGITVSIVNMILLFSLLTVGLFMVHAILLAFFWRLGRPAKPKPWGMIYDQETRKPIAGAIVRIYDQKFGRLLDTAISDRNGKFGFLVGASYYYLTVEAKGFLFPGTTKSTKHDYIGGVVTVSEQDKRVAYDIPMKKMY